MFALTRGRLQARIATDDAGLGRALDLRRIAFGTGADGFDPLCRHVLIEETATGRLVCCFRLLPLADGAAIGRSYAAQFYDLAALADYRGRMLEMGRFCIHPDHVADPDILRVAWAALARLVDAEGVELLFGCASFRGTEAERYRDAFALLHARHRAPRRWLPRIKAPRVFPFARLRGLTPDPRRAFLTLPPLLRGYLALGGWVSDHAVVDHDLGTLHVFTGVEVAAIPPARARLLRAAAA